MRYCELCQAFYIDTTTGGLAERTTQGDIAEFFILTALSDESSDLLPTNRSSFDKWYSGTNNQQPRIWNAFKKDYDESAYCAELESAFGDDDNLLIVAKRLGIKVGQGKRLNTGRFAVAVARQMYAFSMKKGETDNLIPDIYAVSEVEVDFSDYIQKSTDRYNVMKLIGGSEVPLEDYFVCNTLGEKPRVFADKKQIKCESIDNATIEGIRNMYQNARVPYDNRKSILIGSGGSGKTLMLQHLFLDGIERYSETGLMPIFLELRYFTQSDDIESFIVQTVNSRDESFTAEVVHQFLMEGKCPILMDGFDEIDPSDMNDFQTKLKEFTDNKYPRTQVILASRECEAISGLRGYKGLYVWPFDPDKSVKLIDKILLANGEQDAKPLILEYIDSGFIKKDGAFVSHPMLLTFVAMNYPKFEAFYGNHLLFYRKAYEALLTGHDDNKKPYDRVFHSVDNADQFSIVFREFCGKTYSEGVLEFDAATFDLYFNKLSSYKEFKNPHKMTLTNFKHDACSTACMMFERELGIWYIDPGFQEFLFAEYYAQQSSEEMKELGENLWGLSYGTFSKLDAFEMLYGFTKQKVEVCIFLPFLERIFKGKTEEEAFAEFLIAGYEQVTYTVIDEEMIQKYELEHHVRRQMSVQGINEPSTIILSYVSKLLGINPSFIFTTKENAAECKEFAKIALTGEYAYVNGSDETLYLRRNLQEQFDNKSKFEELHDTTRLIRDEKSEIVCFGHEYQIDSFDMFEEPDKFSGVIQTMISDECDAYKAFLKMKDFYKKLRREQQRNRFK